MPYVERNFRSSGNLGNPEVGLQTATSGGFNSKKRLGTE